MICNRCKKNKATVHIDENNQTIHVCKPCALAVLSQQKPNMPKTEIKIISPGNKPPSPQVISDVKHILQILPQLSQQMQPAKVPDKFCDKCGATFKEFLMEGKFSCSDCYEAFAPEIRQMLFTNVGKTQHVGKVPARSCKRLKLKKLVEELKQQLEDEVKNENYETAARLRDTINNLERDVEKHS